MSWNDTIARFTDSERLQLPKTLSDWVVPAAAVAAVAVGVKILVGTKNKDRTPPMISSWLPWIGSDWAIERDPDAFFKLAEQTHGGIYGAKTAGWTFYYVTSMDLINQIYKQPKLFNISVVQLHWGKDVFDFSDRVLPTMGAQLGPVMHHHFAQTNMAPLVEGYDTQFQSVIKSTSVPTTSVSLEDWFMPLTYRATGAMYFGPTFDTDAMWDDWKGFDEGVWKVALGYPTRLCPHFTKSREGALKHFMKYLSKPHEACEVVSTHEEIARNSDFDEREIATIVLSDWWPLMASVPWGSLWTLILQLQQPEGLDPIIAELDAAGAAWSAANPDYEGPYTSHLAAFFLSSPPTPLLSSTLSEVLRFTTDSYSMRGVLVDSADLGGYTFKKNDTLICRTRGVHRDASEFADPDKFVPTRFMSEDGNKGTEGNFKWMPYGGGISMCSGRHFAAQHVRITLTTLLKTYRFEIDRTKSKLPIKLSNINRGFGIRRPDDDLYVNITKI